MKDVLINGKRVEQELKYTACCLIIALAVHVYAIFTYGTQWIELFTQLHITLVLTIVFYLITLCCRFMASGVKKIFHKKKTN